MAAGNNSSDNQKIEWPKEVLDSLQLAGPFWSTLLGAVLLALGWFLHSPQIEGTGIAILAVALLIFASRHPSKLTRKGAFTIGREFFIGREQECDQLIEAIRRAPLLWLSGESGSGKSCLLRLGVVPRLMNGREFLPLYIDTWGSDWEAGPIAALTFALRESVEAFGAKLEVEGRPTASDLGKYLRQLPSLLNRTPVLILDQFDDYVADNVERFHGGRGGLIVTADELKRQNTFWDQLADLLQGNSVRCIFVVRQEQSWGQATISFIAVREFFLPRLQRHFLDKILQELSSGSVENPERGWDALCERLEKDLYASGGILPIQMRVVLRQLSTLRSLNLRAYQRAGGALGLSAAYVGEAVERAAAAAGATPAVVRRILAKLVNPGDQSKTRDMSVQFLQEEPAGSLDLNTLSRVLHQLKSDDIVRSRVDETGNSRWRLDHDYLAVAVDELDRRENRIQKLLDQHAERLRAPGLWKRRNALLGPITLARIIWNRLWGKVRLGDARGVLAASGVVWAIFLTLTVSIIYYGIGSEFDALAARYVISLNRSGNVSREEAKEWARLAQEPLPVRQRVEKIMLSDVAYTDNLIQGSVLTDAPLSSSGIGVFGSPWGFGGNYPGMGYPGMGGFGRAARARIAAAALGGLSPSAPEQFRISLGCATRELTPACVFLASQFGQDAEEVSRKMLAQDDSKPYGASDRTTSICGVGCIAALFDVARFVDESALLDACNHLSTKTTNCWVVRSLRTRSSPEKKDHTEIDIVGSMLGRKAPTNIERTNSGKEMLALTEKDGTCHYSAGSIRADNITTALAALENPSCAANYGEAIQRAIVDATTHIPAGDVDRWTFAREWVRPNAAKYGYNPERFNTSYYCVRSVLQELTPSIFRTADRRP